ncbi:MAG: histidine kinase [Bacteroidota bacterium]
MVKDQNLKWHVRLLIALVISSLLFLMIWMFSQFKEPPGFSLLMNTLLVLMAFICLEGVWHTQRKLFQQEFKNPPYFKNVLAFIVPVLVGTFIYSLLFYFFKWLDYYMLGSEPPLAPHMISAGLIGLILSLIFGLILWMVTWKDSYYQAIIKNESYKAKIVDANLHMLRNQLDPHFIFNNFNTIYYLVDENPKMAKKFLKNVSNIYRHILKNSKENVISVEEELEVLLQYVEVLKERFGGAFQVENRIDQKHLQQKFIPPLVLHELIENVVKHNQIDKENQVHLKLLSQEEYLVLSNTRVPKVSTDSTKSGLQNIMERYDLLTESKVVVEELDDNFLVQVPLIDCPQK